VQSVVERLRAKTKCNMARDVRIAAPYYRSNEDASSKAPDYYLQQTEDWLVLPYELTDISRQEMVAHKAWIVPLLDELKPGWS